MSTRACTVHVHDCIVKRCHSLTVARSLWQRGASFESYFLSFSASDINKPSKSDR